MLWSRWRLVWRIIRRIFWSLFWVDVLSSEDWHASRLGIITSHSDDEHGKDCGKLSHGMLERIEASYRGKLSHGHFGKNCGKLLHRHARQLGAENTHNLSSWWMEVVPRSFWMRQGMRCCMNSHALTDFLQGQLCQHDARFQQVEWWWWIASLSKWVFLVLQGRTLIAVL